MLRGKVGGRCGGFDRMLVGWRDVEAGDETRGEGKYWHGGFEMRGVDGLMNSMCA